MNSESRICQNCKTDFTITPDDFSFYEKIKVPAPTFCPECRMIRRLSWRNNRSLYKRECHLCKKTVIGMYAEDGAPVMCSECYNSDAWDRHAYARSVDWSKDFFSQIYEIFKKQPRVFQYRIGTVVNSDFGNSVVNSKDVYLGYSIIESENIMYSESVDKSRDSIDSLIAHEIDQCSWNISSDKNYNSHFLVQSQSNIDSYFLFDCTNCQHCCLSNNLRNQSYVFENKKLSKEAYAEKIKELQLYSRTGFESAKKRFTDIVRESIHKYAQIYASVNVTGDFVNNAKNSLASFDIQSSEDIKYSARIIKSKDMYDCYAVLTGELEYETMSGSENCYKQIGSMLCFSSKDIEYSMFCRNCSNCFGCIGLKNSSYCILNTQYTKEEYEILVPKIRQHMLDMPYIDNLGRKFTYGEFFPYEFSPFSYDETVAQYYFPLDENGITHLGYKFISRDRKSNVITITSEEIPDSINDVSDSILNETLGCVHGGECEHQCTVAFRVTQKELQFLQSKNLPLPNKCPNCRHYERLGFCNTYRLWSRTCMCEKSDHGHEAQCKNEFETTYAPDRPEKVYCESCYQKEVL